MKKIFCLALFWSLNLSAADVTVSGLSSGAFMAAQMHVAHSKTFSGVAILAGGPYACSGGQVAGALMKCMQTFLGKPNGADLYSQATEMGEQGKIDSVENLAGSRVVLVTGPNDNTVASSVVYENKNFYSSLAEEAIKVIDDLPVGHAFPTLDKGNSCSTASASPWVSACGRDVAGEILQHFYGTLAPAQTAKEKNFFSFPQPMGNSMDTKGIAYIPEKCQKDLKCPIHMSLHGCQQGLANSTKDATNRGVGDFYFKNVGFNEWAEANDIILIYPQAISSAGNPNQCWDWWGYISSDYLTQSAPQIQALKTILDQFQSNTVSLSPY